MRQCILLLLVAFTCSLQSITAQKKKVKKLSKQEKKNQKFELQKQALRDTTFAFQTTHIKVPAVSRYRTGGYLNIEDNVIRVQEIDWPENNSSLLRLRDQAELYDYVIIKSNDPNLIIVQFKGRIKGTTYNFSIRNSLADSSELTMSIKGRQTVIYKGKVKRL